MTGCEDITNSILRCQRLSRRLTRQMQNPVTSRASTTYIPVSVHWNVQKRLAGW